jgi:alcohol dehydrogenase (cytochrome c)
MEHLGGRVAGPGTQSTMDEVPRLVLLLGAMLALAGCGGSRTAAANPGSAPVLVAAADSSMLRALSNPAAWPSYGRDYTNQRYSPLSQITQANVQDLRLAWQYHTGVPHEFEASPVVVDGTMYLSTPLNHAVALEAGSGRKLWEYVHQLDTTIHCCGAVNRGLAVYGERVYMGTLDAKLVALDARNGRKVWDVQVADNTRGYALTGPPVAIDGKVIIGVSGAEYGIRGFVSAYDARSGSEVWRFHTIPSPAEGGWWGAWRTTDHFGTPLHRNIARERADSARFADAWKTGGGSMWQAPAVDSELGLVIFAVGNPSPDLDGSVRPGDNLYTNSIVAVDLRTGKLRWYFQELPHDVWDLDAASPVVLFDTRDSTGRVLRAAAQAGKTGWVYVVDRTTGRPLRRSDPFVPQDNIFALPTESGTRMLPGANGGSEWSPPAYDPQTGYLYVLGLHQPMLYKVRHDSLQPPAMWLGGAFVGTGEPEYGLFSAVDLHTGKIAWQQRIKDPMVGGALATAGGVVFTGTKDKLVLAFDARTGERLWQHQANGGVNAPPISYAVDGRQYVAVAAGGNYQINAPRSDELLVFALGPKARAALPPAPADVRRPEGR